MSSNFPRRRFLERFGSLNPLRSNPFSRREKILDLTPGVLDPLAQLAESMLERSYSVDSLEGHNGIFRARVLAVTKAVPSIYSQPALHSNSTTVDANGVAQVEEHYICRLRNELDSFLPSPEQFSEGRGAQAYVSLTMMQGYAISAKPVEECLEPFGVGDIVEVSKPNINSWQDAVVTRVIVRNNANVLEDPENRPSSPYYASVGVGPFSHGGPVTSAPFQDQGMSSSSPFLFPTDSEWTSKYKPGIDVSSFQDPSALNWQTLYDEGVRWVIIKSSEGTGRLKSRGQARVYNTAIQHTVNVLRSGLPIRIGYYHYCRADTRPEGTDYTQDALNEANTFLFETNDIIRQAQEQAGITISNDQLLPLAIDIEFKGGLSALKPSIWPGQGRTSEYQQSEQNGLTKEQLLEWVQIFADRLEEVREPPMFYVGPNLTGTGLGLSSVEAVRTKLSDPSKQWTRNALWTMNYPRDGDPSSINQSLVRNPSPRRASSIPGPWAFSTWQGTTPNESGPAYNDPPPNGPNSNWTIWQFTGKGRLRGNTAGTDLDLNVAKAELFDQTRFPVRTGSGAIPASPNG